MRASDLLACQFDILLTTENLSDALMHSSYHSGIKATRTSQHCGKTIKGFSPLCEWSFYRASGFHGNNGNGKRKQKHRKKKIVPATSTVSRTVFYFVHFG